MVEIRQDDDESDDDDSDDDDDDDDEENFKRNRTERTNPAGCVR